MNQKKLNRKKPNRSKSEKVERSRGGSKSAQASSRQTQVLSEHDVASREPMLDGVWRLFQNPFVLFLIVVFVWFGPSLLGIQKLGFRDVNHFYLPLYEYLSERLGAGELPLWNPLLMTGVPVVGDNTSAIFYLPRLIFQLGFPTEMAMAFYVVLHLGLAFWGAHYAARNAGATSETAGLAALVYGLSSPVVQQYCNPPFMVGAAWLPFAVSGLFQTIQTGSRRSVAVAAVALAMPVLGGDPQSTMHAVLIGSAAWLVHGFRHWRWKAPPPKDELRPGFRTLPMALACGLAFFASIIQIAPTLGWSKFSGRSNEAPPGVARMLGTQDATATYRWYEEAPRGSHAKMIYDYSTGIWNIADLVIPNAMGSPYPINARLERLFCDAETFWLTSIYCGLPALLALAAYLSSRKFNRWALLAIAGCLLITGSYGPVWALRTIADWFGVSILANVNPAIGGPFWFLVTFVPGYASFRYSSKWIPVIALGLAVSMALFFSRAKPSDFRRVSKWSYGIAIALGLVFFVSLMPALKMWLIERMQQRVTTDMTFGPLNIDVALLATRMALVHAVVVAIVVGFRTRMAAKSDGIDQSFVRHLSLIVAIDLFVAGCGWVHQVPRQRVPLTNLNTEEIQQIKRHGVLDGYPVLRYVDVQGRLPVWLTQNSALRFEELDMSEQRTLLALWNLAHDVPNFNAPSTITPDVHPAFWATASQVIPPSQPQQWTNVFRWLSIRQSVRYGRIEVQVTPSQDTLVVTSPQWTRTAAPLPLVRWTTESRGLPLDGSMSPAEMWRLMLPDIVRDPESCPVWISGLLDSQTTANTAPISTSEPEIEIAHTDSSSATIIAKHNREGWLYVPIFQDGNWRAVVEPFSATTDSVSADSATKEANRVVIPKTANLIGQGIHLRAGHWRIRFEYRPTWIFPSFIASLLAWAVIALLALKGKKSDARERASEI